MNIFKRGLCFIITLAVLVSMCTSAVAVCGDFDNNGIHNLSDARTVLLYVTQIEEMDYEEAQQADINRDGYVNTEDVRLILSYVAKHQTAKPHEYSEWEPVVSPGCTEEGYEWCECLICGEEFYKNLPAKGHTPVDVTCETSGYCADCGCEIPPTGHKYVDYVCVYCNHNKIMPTVSVDAKNVSFGATQADIKSVLGEPTHVLNDTVENGNVTIFVYAKDYANLNIFTFLNDSFVELYTNSHKTVVSKGKNSYYLNKTKYTQIEEVTYMPYVDYQHEDGEYEYAYTAVYGDWMYLIRDGKDSKVSEQLIFHALNGCRAINGLAPLKFCTKARTSAYKHSLDMAQNDYFDHTNLKGELPWDRMEKEGIKYSYCAENIASGHISAYQMNNGWYNSKAGHREAMLEPRFDYVGVGVTDNGSPDYRSYGTENFYQSIN